MRRHFDARLTLVENPVLESALHTAALRRLKPYVYIIEEMMMTWSTTEWQSCLPAFKSLTYYGLQFLYVDRRCIDSGFCVDLITRIFFTEESRN
jgi:hypothetical protein